MITLALRLIDDHPHLVMSDRSGLVEVCRMQPEPGKPLICSYMRCLILDHEVRVRK